MSSEERAVLSMLWLVCVCSLTDIACSVPHIDEMIRQITIECAERGLLLLR